MSSFSLFRLRILSIWAGFLGFATNTYRCIHTVNIEAVEHGYLEYMKCLELDILTFVSKKVHHHLQVSLVRDIPRHNIEVGPVEENFSEEFQRLPFCHVVV